MGMSKLDVSKILTYIFHYDVIEPKYEESIELCCQDMNSYVCHIHTENIYADMKMMPYYFDNSV